MTLGTLVAAALMTAGLALDVAGNAQVASLVGNVGVAALLATPAAALIATWWELRRPRPSAARLALAVLGVLAVATVIALMTR